MPRNINKTGRSRSSSRFVMLEHYLLDSPAWRSLSLCARCCFIEIARRYTPGRNGRIAQSARMIAEALPVSRATATRALKELADKGFVEVVRPGGFNMKSGARRATEWRLTLYRCDVTGERASKAFMRWQQGRFHLSDSQESHNGFVGEPEDASEQ